MKRYFLLWLGILICGYFFYIRVILKRMPREVCLEWNAFRSTVYITLFTTFIILIWKKLFRKESQNWFIICIKERLMFPLLQAYEGALMTVHDYFIEEEKIKIKPIIVWLINLINQFFNHLMEKKKDSYIMTPTTFTPT